MNKFFRLELKNWNFLLWFVFFAMAVQYLLLRIPRSMHEQTIATVNGESITLKALQRGIIQEKALQEVIAQYFGRKIDMPVSPEAVLKKMVQQELLEGHAHKAGVYLGEDFVSQQIFGHLPSYVFKQDGSVEMTAYKEFVRTQGFTVAEYEVAQERALVQSFMYNIVHNSVVMPQWLLGSEWLKSFVKKKYAIGTLSYKSLESELDKSGITDDRLKTYYSMTKELYRTPETRKVRVATITIDDYKKNVSFSEEELKAFYNRHKDRLYTGVPEIKYRELFVAKDDKGEAKKKVEELLTMVRKEPGKFESLTKEYARNKKQAIYTVVAGETPEPIRRAAFRLKTVDTVSSVIQTPEGFSIIQLVERKAPEVKPFESVKGEIVKKLKSDQASRQLTAKAKGIIRACKEDQSLLDGLVKELGGSFKAQTMQKGEEATPLSKAVFAQGLKEGSIHFVSDAEKVSLFQVESIVPTEVASFVQVKDEVKDAFIQSELKQLAKKRAKEVHTALLEGKSMSELGLKKTETSFMVEKDIRKEIKKKAEFSEKMVFLRDSKHVLRYHTDDGYVFIQLVDTEEEAMPTDLAEQQKTFALQNEAYKELWLEAFIAYLEKNATIVYNTKILQS